MFRCRASTYYQDTTRRSVPTDGSTPARPSLRSSMPRIWRCEQVSHFSDRNTPFHKRLRRASLPPGGKKVRKRLGTDRQRLTTIAVAGIHRHGEGLPRVPKTPPGAGQSHLSSLPSFGAGVSPFFSSAATSAQSGVKLPSGSSVARQEKRVLTNQSSPSPALPVAATGPVASWGEPASGPLAATAGARGERPLAISWIKTLPVTRLERGRKQASCLLAGSRRRATSGTSIVHIVTQREVQIRFWSVRILRHPSGKKSERAAPSLTRCRTSSDSGSRMVIWFALTRFCKELTDTTLASL